VTGGSDALAAGAAQPRKAWSSPTAVVAALAILPGVILSLIGWRYSANLAGLLPVELTNAHVLRRVLSTIFDPSTYADSWRPMQQALAVLAGPDRDTLYETLFFQQGVRFQYPPTSLIPLELLSKLGISSVRALNAINSLALVLNAASLAGLALVLFRPRAQPSSSDWPSQHGMAVLAAGCTFLFYPVMRAHVLGQIQLWIDLLFTLSVLMWVLEKRLAAGVLVGLACAIKPQLGLVVLWALLWGQNRFLAGALLVLVPLALVSVGRYGLHNHLEYLQVLSFLSRHGESFFANNSINGILNGYLSPDDTLRWSEAAFTPFNPIVYAGTLASSLVFYGLLILRPLWSRGRRPEAADFAAAAICTILGSPVAWEHHYGLLAPLFLLALHAALSLRDARPRLTVLSLTFIAWVLVANFIPFASLLAGTPFAIAQAYCFFGALLLLGALLAIRPDPIPAR
jgi:hypothetical protein